MNGNPTDSDEGGRQKLPAGGEEPSAGSPPDSAGDGHDDRSAPGIETPDRSAEGGFPVVGIGASAGGIEALIRLFEATPSDSGMAFLVVMHLDPTRESALAHILGKHTAMPVVEAADGMAIGPDRVYVIAPDASLTVADGRIRLTDPPERRGHRYPIDRLFASLAQHRRERAICIVLSGTGSDGTEGLKEVKAHGGCILVQDPATARFDGMPRSAIMADLADQVLAPEQMSDALLRYVRHVHAAEPQSADDATPDGNAINSVLTLLHTRAGQDFRHYKAGTLMRRIRRRMGLNGVPNVGDYVDLLRASPAELEILVKDLMISVTGFFRDPDAWKALDEAVLAPLVAARQDDRPVRVWVPACATGEEAYTLAMLLVSRAEAANKRLDIKLFATDGREDNLDLARAGIYSEGAVATVPPDLLKRFFDEFDGNYQVKKELRDLVVFAAHNLLRDPPFSRLDLVSCRNLLIYLDPVAQRRALALLHFALREGGCLLLGSAETVGRQEDLFEPVSKKWRIYRRLGPTRHGKLDFPALPILARSRHVAAPGSPEASQPPVRPAELARRALLARFAPASVLVDRDGHALWFHGETGDYLAPPPGEPSRDLLAMARAGLRTKLSAGMRRATREKQPVTLRARVRRNGSAQAVTVIVAPVAAPGATDDMLLISFCGVETPLPTDAASGGHGAGPPGKGESRSADDELETTRAELQDTIDRLGSVNEELKAANEEVTSMNEELQSTNEELESSQEEMQSFNEELQTLNSQLQHKIQEVEDASDRLSNLLAGSEVATVFLDADLCIMWFSPASTELLELVPSDVGRPITNFAWKVADEALLRDAGAVLRNLSGIDAEVRSEAGRWYLRRLLPYRTHDNRIAGVVVSFFDITDRKQATDAVNEARIYAETIIETVRHPILVLDGDLRVQSVNPAFLEAFSCLREKTDGYPLHELDHGAWDIPELRQLLRKVLKDDRAFQGFAVRHDFPRLGQRSMLLNASKLARGGERQDLILLAIEDVTARVDAEEQSAILIDELSHRVKNMLAMVQSLAFQTLRRSRSLDEFREAFEGRLHALGRTHDLLVQQDWGSAELGQIVRQTFEPHGAGERITVEGPALHLTPEAGVAMAMVLHELATNAVKYGALSRKSGHLRVTWRVEDGAEGEFIRLRWIESGGPPVTPPSRFGFGSRLIERTIVNQLGGTATPEFRADGLHYVVVVPLQGNHSRSHPTRK